MRYLRIGLISGFGGASSEAVSQEEIQAFIASREINAPMSVSTMTDWIAAGFSARARSISLIAFKVG